jgi:hypothetical protein
VIRGVVVGMFGTIGDEKELWMVRLTWMSMMGRSCTERFWKFLTFDMRAF